MRQIFIQNWADLMLNVVLATAFVQRNFITTDIGHFFKLRAPLCSLVPP
jgi:hypothetical protein